jgi:hypothetical protein
MNWSLACVAVASLATGFGISYFIYLRKMKTLAAHFESYVTKAEVAIRREADLLAQDLRRFL